MASHGVARSANTASRTEQEIDNEQREIKEYRDLENMIRTKVAGHEQTVELFELTSRILKKNPEYYTIWNHRRRLLTNSLFPKALSAAESVAFSSFNTASIAIPITSIRTESQTHDSRDKIKNDEILQLISDDLDFIIPIMIKYPKCYWIWNYRLWLLQQANEKLDRIISRNLWTRELALVEKMLVRDNRNFHGWGYRRMIVAQLEDPRLDGQSMVESEFEYTTKMINAPNGLSNFSAWHRRSKLIPRLLNERVADTAARYRLLDDELELIISAMYTDSYPYQQSAWFYYQFLMTIIIEPSKSTATINFTKGDRQRYVIQQIEILKDMLDGAEDCKWIYDTLIEFTLVISRMQNRGLHVAEKQDCISWLKKLKVLDHFRIGRWNDREKLLVDG